MTNPFFSFIFEVIGAFIVWTVKGFNGKLTDEMSRPYESSKKSIRNTLISAVFVFCIYLLFKYDL